jgi:hypothetical protein
MTALQGVSQAQSLYFSQTQNTTSITDIYFISGDKVTHFYELQCLASSNSIIYL